MYGKFQIFSDTFLRYIDLCFPNPSLHFHVNADVKLPVKNVRNLLQLTKQNPETNISYIKMEV